MNTLTLAEHDPAAPAVATVATVADQPQMTVIQAAIAGGASADQLERILDLQVRADNHRLDLMREQRRMQEEDRKRDAMLAFRRDFSAFRGENIIVPKDKLVDRGRAGTFYQAQYYVIARLISPALSRHGFSFRHDQVFGVKPLPTEDNPNAFIGWVTITCFLEHKDGHTETLVLEGPEGDQSANTHVQNMQVTASYLKRQSLLAITGTATGHEDDESRMQRQQAQRGDSEATQADPLETLRDAGRDHAMRGMKALTDWWASLTARDRNELSPDFKGFRAAAQAADKGVSHV